MKAFEIDALWRDVAEVILTADDPEVLLRRTIQAIEQPLQVSCCMACEPSDAGDYHLMCHAGFAEGELTAPVRSDLGDQLPALISSGTKAGPTKGRLEALATLGCRAFICEPVTVSVESSGVIVIGSREKDDFSELEVEVLQAIARFVGIALQRLRTVTSLSSLDRRKDEFLATLAHELRNPLAAMHNSLQVIRLSHNDAATLHHARSIMERQVEQMVRLVNELQDVSRIASNRIELQREWVELGTILKTAVETSRPMIEAAGHTLTVKLPPQPVLLDADPVRLVQVVSNLLNNSAKYTERGGQITISAERDGNDVEIRVRDTGIGISLDELPHIFRMFVQAEGSVSRSQGGLGLGLTLVKRLVELHGGTVRAFSDGPGKGSEFVICLPVLVVPSHDADHAQATHVADRERPIVVSDDALQRGTLPSTRPDTTELGPA